ncbi:MAG: WG repeat-containing protein, partial [Flavipsychrobacter sp.]
MRNKLLLTLLSITLISSCKQANNTGFSYKLIPVKETSEWGYIDSKGATKIPFNYQMAYPFSEGLAQVTDENGKVGYINEYGTYVIKPQYKSGTYFSEGQAFVVGDEGYPECIDKKGSVLFVLKDIAIASVYSEGLAVVYTNGKYGFINKEGKIVINPQYDVADNFSEGLAAVAVIEEGKEKYGFIDKEGKLIIPYQFSTVTAFSEGRALAANGTDIHCIGKDGKDAFPTDKANYDYVGTFSEGYAPAAQGNKVKYVDKTGKVQFDEGYNSGRPFHKGLAAVKKGDKWGYIDTKGKEIINCQFDEASSFYGDIAVVKLNGKYGLIDKTGLYTVQPKYNDAFCHYEMAADDDPKPENVVHSEYINPEDVAEDLLGNGNKEQVLGIDGSQSLKDILLKIQYDNIAAAKINSITDSTVKMLGTAAKLVYTQYDFDGQVVNSRGFMLDETVFPTEVIYAINLPENGIKTANAIKNILENRFQAQEVSDNDNTDPNLEEYNLKKSTTDYYIYYNSSELSILQSFR